MKDLLTNVCVFSTNGCCHTTHEQLTCPLFFPNLAILSLIPSLRRCFKRKVSLLRIYVRT